MSESQTIDTSHCNDCKRRGVGVEHFHHGESVMFLCKACSPKGFEAVARRQIDSWLNGGTLPGASR